MAELVARLDAFRRAAGTDVRADYEVMVGLKRIPTLDDCRRLEELGVTSISVAPWGPDPVTDRHRVERLVEGVRRFGDSVAARL